MLTALLIIAVLWLGYANGANDNFKGVATLWGSRAASFRGALAWATAATVAGSLMSVLVATELVDKFKGKDLVPVELLQTPELALAAAGAAAITIIIATIIGMPTSTTHALVGGLLGGVAVATGRIAGAPALQAFFIPLLVSPVLAIVLAWGLYKMLRAVRLRLGVERETCLCIGPSRTLVPLTAARAPSAVERTASSPEAAAPAAPGLPGAPRIEVGDRDVCVERYAGRVIGVDAHTAVNAVHYVSAGAVCFGRAMNDTPKIAALLLATGASFTFPIAALVTAAVAAGGLLQARKVARTMSERITDINPGQGLTANLVTAALVLVASRMGVPVSTTHVSCGSIFGIGAAGGAMRWRTVRRILLTWVTTLPMGVVLGMAIYWLLTR